MTDTEQKRLCCGLKYSGLWLIKFCIKNFLLLGLMLALIIGLAFPHPGVVVSSWKVCNYAIVKTLNICLIFFIAGLTLKTSELTVAVKAYKEFVYALFSILVITPLAGFVALKIPYNPFEFAIGLTVFCAVPTTIASGVAMVLQAEGNYALALMITICSNFLGVATVPFMLKLMLEEAVSGVLINAVSLLISLIITILIPLLIGKFLQMVNKPIQTFSSQYKTGLSMVASGSLIVMVWQSVSESQNAIIDTRLTSILLITASTIILHVVYLVINYTVARLARFNTAELRTVVIMASQKTLPVSLTIISYLNMGEQGLIVLPCIIGHHVELLIDAYIVSRWNSKDDKLKELQNQDYDKHAVNGIGTEEVKQGMIEVKMESDLSERLINNRKQKSDII